MIVCIVGSEAAKFTQETEKIARQAIITCLSPGDFVISGACHLGGIDRWAIEEAKALGLETQEYPPATQKWEGGYKQRNLAMAEACDKCVCITVKEYHENYTGMRFEKKWNGDLSNQEFYMTPAPVCYHCKTIGNHVKSGGCWTMKEAAKLGKQTQLIVI